MTTKGSHFIDGKWMSGSGPALQSTNPATGDIVWKGDEAQEDLVEKSIQAARSAFQEWSQQPLSVRIHHLKAFSAALNKEKRSLAEAISQENGKPLWDALNEVTTMINKVTISIEAYQMRCPDIEKKIPQGLSITRHRPHGVLAVLGPFNFPGHIPNGHIVPALLAGNTVVFKPSELTPWVAELTVRCWEESKLPPGVINLVQGSRNTGAYLSQHPDIDGLLFTGSWNTGRQLAEMLAKAPYKILALEMGGNNPLIVGAIDNFDAAAYLTIQSAFLSAGQRCTCARRLIVLEGQQGDKFLEALIAMTKTIKVGAYTDSPEPFMGPVISAQAAEKLLADQKKLVALGGDALLPLMRLQRGAAFLSPGIIDVTASSERPDEEYFGPLLQVIRVADFPAALIEANRTHFGLTAGLLSNDRQEYLSFYKTIKAGIVNWNTPTTGASSAAPFGGLGYSGNNRPSALYAADYCAYPVASMEAEKVLMPENISPGINPAN